MHLKFASASVVMGFLAISCASGSGEQQTPRWGAPAPGSFAAVQRQVKVGDTQELTDGAVASATFFGSTGFRPGLGRPFVHAEYGTTAHNVVILHHGFWQAKFGGSPATIGQTIQIDGQEFVIVGVAPPGFDIPATAKYWLPKPSE